MLFTSLLSEGTSRSDATTKLRPLYNTKFVYENNQEYSRSLQYFKLKWTFKQKYSDIKFYGNLWLVDH